MVKFMFGFCAIIFVALSCGPKQASEADARVATDASDVPAEIRVQTKDGARLFAEPDDGSQVLTELPDAQQLVATDARGLFLKVSHGELSGWVHAAFLLFDQNGQAFMRAKNQNGKTESYEARRARIRRGKTTGEQTGLRQCAHIHGNGSQCKYMTGDDSGLCPEHQ